MPHGGARPGSGRKVGSKFSDTVQITARVRPETLRRLKAEAERRKPAGQKIAKIGKVIDDLANELPEG
jgi:hypothetical protein